MSYLDDWLEAMTVPGESDPQEQAQFRKSMRGPTLRDLLGAQDSFQIMGPNGQVDQARTDELLNSPYRGPALKTENYSVYTPSGSLNAETLRSLSRMRAANPLMDKSPEERKRLVAEADVINERTLYESATRGDRNAIAEMNRRKAINDANQLKFRELVKLASGDPDTAAALLERITGIKRGKSRLEKIEEEARLRERIRREEAPKKKTVPPELFQAIGTPDFMSKLAANAENIDDDDAFKLITAHRQGLQGQKDRNDEPAMLRAGLKAIEAIDALHKEKFTGFLQGRQGAIKSTTGFISSQEADFRSALGQLELETKKALIGTAQSAEEIKSFVKAFPSVNNSDEQFIANVKQTKLNLQRKLTELEAARGRGTLTPQTEATSSKYKNMSNEELLKELQK